MSSVQKALDDVAECISTYVDVLQTDDGTHVKRCVEVLSVLNDCVVSLHSANIQAPKDESDDE